MRHLCLWEAAPSPAASQSEAGSSSGGMVPNSTTSQVKVGSAGLPDFFLFCYLAPFSSGLKCGEDLKPALCRDTSPAWSLGTLAFECQEQRQQPKLSHKLMGSFFQDRSFQGAEHVVGHFPLAVSTNFSLKRASRKPLLKGVPGEVPLPPGPHTGPGFIASFQCICPRRTQPAQGQPHNKTQGLRRNRKGSYGNPPICWTSHVIPDINN